MELKYPEYVTTDSDIWNSADEAYFFVVKGKAKKLPINITPIIENALQSGLIRAATKEEIEQHKLEEEIERTLREGRIERGFTWEKTIENYLQWKENKNRSSQKNTIKKDDSIENHDVESAINNVLDETNLQGLDLEKNSTIKNNK